MLWKLVKRFTSNRRGNFAIVTIAAFPVVFGGAALAVDVVNVLRLQTELQNANDTGVLFATRFYQVNNTLPSDTEVFNFVQANYASAMVSSIATTFDRKNNLMTVKATSNAKPMMMGYFGAQTSQLAAISQATLGINGSLEFSLALDTTESMLEDDRIGALKTAANNFVNILFDMKNRGADVKGAIVPFARYVNVGVSRRNEVWMNVPKDIDTRKSVEVLVKERPVIGEKDCRMVFTPAHSVNIPAIEPSCTIKDGFEKCEAGRPARTENVQARNDRVCDPVFGPEKSTVVTKTTGRLIKWKGCVSSRTYPLNVTDAYDGDKFPGVLDVKCPSEVQPLTGVKSVLTAKINGLVPVEDTYIPEGVMWGARMLTNAQPFSEAKPMNGNARPVRKALVIMTDGKNTLSPQIDAGAPSGNQVVHTGKDEVLANDYTAKSCDQAKAAGLEVYTISFGNQVPNYIRDLLEKCASKPQLFFHASNSAGLNQAFDKIADELLSIRLTQ